jgi:diacylglycerol O-acyltransferase-1
VSLLIIFQSNISEYWRLWNSPVYSFAKRHIYLPLLITHKCHPSIALFAVFFVSAALHELIVGIPTHNLSFYAFGGMMLQIPLIIFTNLLEGFIRPVESRVEGEVFTAGNLIFWISFCIGIDSF